MASTNKKQILNRYVGPLLADEIARGMNAARQNARRLASDAKILFDAGRFPTAAAIAILSIEESGKTTILRRLATARHDSEIRKSWKEYRTHRAKNPMSILPMLVSDGARHLEQLAEATNVNGEHTAEVDALKQIALYTDCFGNRHWSMPSDAIDEGLARQLVATAEVLAQEKEISVREVELWREHMTPRDGVTALEMKDALIRWHQEMVNEGLASNSQEEFERFVLGPEAGPIIGDDPKPH